MRAIGPSLISLAIMVGVESGGGGFDKRSVAGTNDSRLPVTPPVNHDALEITHVDRRTRRLRSVSESETDSRESDVLESSLSIGTWKPSEEDGTSNEGELEPSENRGNDDDPESDGEPREATITQGKSKKIENASAAVLIAKALEELRSEYPHRNYSIGYSRDWRKRLKLSVPIPKAFKQHSTKDKPAEEVFVMRLKKSPRNAFVGRHQMPATCQILTGIEADLKLGGWLTPECPQNASLPAVPTDMRAMRSARKRFGRTVTHCPMH